MDQDRSKQAINILNEYNKKRKIEEQEFIKTSENPHTHGRYRV